MTDAVSNLKSEAMKVVDLLRQVGQETQWRDKSQTDRVFAWFEFDGLRIALGEDIGVVEDSQCPKAYRHADYARDGRDCGYCNFKSDAASDNSTSSDSPLPGISQWLELVEQRDRLKAALIEPDNGQIRCLVCKRQTYAGQEILHKDGCLLVAGIVNHD